MVTSNIIIIYYTFGRYLITTLYLGMNHILET